MRAARALLAAALAAAAAPALAQEPPTPAAAPAAAPRLTSDAFGGLEARALGPATMSGRIAALDAVASDPLTLYVGAASGGVWKSIDGGTTFRPIFDDHTQSIGAVRVDPTDPKTIWVGTGESWVRNSVSIGDGVYRSADGGESWTRMGLEASERIARIEVDPRARDTVFVCATGPLWSTGGQRGVWKTTDGGKSWRNVLAVDGDTGCSDLAIDPQEPGILYAGMWRFRRYPDFFDSGGATSGLYRSADGGESWTRLGGGLPAGPLGRVAVAVAPSRPSTVYALLEAKEDGKQTTAIWRSDDAGSTWSRRNDSFNVQVRPFYFAYLVVDPLDHQRVYKPGLVLTVSTDGAKSFTSPFVGGFGGQIHSDHHALWIHPRRPNELLLGTDGGLYASRNRGATWSFARNLPIGQFYKVAVDDQRPYRIYGGLQDNSAWVGPSESWGGIENSDWTPLSGGDGFATFPDAREPAFVYTTIQGGIATRVDLRTGEAKDIKPYAGAGEGELRFNWNAGFVPSPNDPATIYIGSQYLLRSRDRGESWERISPDLTTNDPARQRQKSSGGLSVDNSTAENNTTIYTIAESPVDARTIWAGTDDGNLQVTRDGGASWTNVIDRLPGVPRGAWIARVEASRTGAGTAYVAVDDHRRGDFASYLYRTRDGGGSWERLPTEGVEGWIWTILEDRERPELLFLGTEWGLWISIDAGASWARFEGGLPKRVAVHDLALQAREGDLVIGTHGRGVYVLDDLRPLRALSAEVLAQEVAILPTRPAEQRLRSAIGDWFGGDDEFSAPNPSSDAAIVYWLKKRHLFGDLKVEVYDAAGKLVATIPGGKRVGLNRVLWATRLKPPKIPPASSLLFGGFEGPRVAEGTYRVRLVKGKTSLESEVRLVADPRNPHSEEDRRAKQATEMRLYDDIERLGYVGDQLVALRDGARQRREKAPGATAKRLGRLADDAEALRTSFVATGDGYIGGDEKLREHLGNLYGNVLGFEGRPSPGQLARLEILEAKVTEVEARFASLVAGDLAAANGALGKAGLEPLAVASREEWRAAEGPTAAAGGGALSSRQVARLQARAPWLRAMLDAVPRAF